MALSNDNLWGYIPSFITKYKVRWIEMAAVLPCWTSMICYYVEGDYGHMMKEIVGKAQDRYAVHGRCYSFVMPWEDIIRELNLNMSDLDLERLPREDECLKYMLRLHLRVAGKDFHQHLRQVHLRPFVLVELLYELIDRKHSVFCGKGSAEALKRRMAARVAGRYPEQEPDVPLEQRRGTIPPSLLQVLLTDEAEAEKKQRGIKCP